MKERESHQYDDIIHLSHPVSSKHPQMSMTERAAQFSAFAALTGYNEAVKETARHTTEKVKLDETTKLLLNEKLMLLQHSTAYTPATITYFVPDQKKAGGVYVTVTGVIKKIDSYERVVILQGGEQIPIDDIYEVEV